MIRQVTSGRHSLKSSSVRGGIREHVLENVKLGARNDVPAFSVLGERIQRLGLRSRMVSFSKTRNRLFANITCHFAY